jgi:hypothetical protein
MRIARWVTRNEFALLQCQSDTFGMRRLVGQAFPPGHSPAVAFPKGYPLMLPSLLSFGKLTLPPGGPRIELPVESGLSSPVRMI